jgi:quercetin dioxygenase-like cupin family protein
MLPTPAPTRAQIDRLEGAMRQMPQIDIPVTNTFGPGFYARTIHIAAGTTLTGKVHSTEHIFIVSKGTIALATEDGERLVHAPFQMVCRPGLKRVGHAITDVECTNIHITDETDMARLEAALIIPETLAMRDLAEVLS